jgi:hypothetical protein
MQLAHPVEQAFEVGALKFLIATSSIEQHGYEDRQIPIRRPRAEAPWLARHDFGASPTGTRLTVSWVQRFMFQGV